jgi:UPF0755 protein
VSARRAQWLATATLGVVLLLIALWLADRSLVRSVEQPGAHGETVRVQVPAGATGRSVLRLLAERGVIADARPVEWWLRLHGRDLRMRAGTYEIPPHASARAALERIASGQVVLESLTIVEGWTFRQMRRAVESHPGIRPTLRGRSDADVMAEMGRPGLHPEGRFYPDTYRFAAGTSDLEIYRIALRQLEAALQSAWSQRADDLPLKSPDELLVLSSIVEKETGLAAERPRIAGVFVSRLRRGMRLQSDPTVIYGLGDGYDGDIRSRDLVTDTPYNTYTRGGLPPTPIALVGREALVATAAPDVTGDLFFVATGEADGAHVFSRTYAEHRAAVQRMLRRQRERGLL